MDRERSRRYEDGEVRRYGAGESYRPYNRDRSPRGARSPLRDRGRTPPGTSDSYVPSRSPRRRSRSGDRYRQRDRSRDGESWRRRDRSRSRARSPARRTSPRRSPPRRSPPRYSSPRRDDRSDRARSPRRDYESRDSRRRSRSPYDRDRGHRNRSPVRRSPPVGPRGGSYRPRSRSPERRDDRYGSGSTYRRPSPHRESALSSTMTSRSASGRSSPRPGSNRGRDDRSRPDSPVRSPLAPSTSGALPVREPSKPPSQDVRSTPTRSPPRGPAALRQPPTGPSASRNFTATSGSPAVVPAARNPSTPSGPAPRPDITSPTIPPSGPRGYVPPRGGAFVPRGGRGAWSSMPPRHMSGPSVSPTIPPSGPAAIPTGPRAASTSSNAPSPSLAPKPFNPPTGPASQHGAAARPMVLQGLMSMPAIVPGGKIEPSLAPLTTGVTKDLEPQYKRHKEEEERIREELKAKQEKLRKSLRIWDKLERESKAFELKSDLSEKSLKNIAGEGLGGAAF